ncbi:MAG: hypothetical protein RR454_03525 [Clostridia bacterium]
MKDFMTGMAMGVVATAVTLASMNNSAVKKTKKLIKKKLSDMME